jgi:uncharacterized repeat protein (TIGR01451 family)
MSKCMCRRDTGMCSTYQALDSEGLPVTPLGQFPGIEMLFFKSNWPIAFVNTAQAATIFIAFLLCCSDVQAQTAAGSSPKTTGYAPKAAASAPGAAASAAAAEAAPPANPIVSSYQAEKVVKDAKGREKLEPLKTFSPGDVVRYTGFHKNTGPYNLLDVNLGVGIPAGMVVLPGGTTPENGKLVKQANGAQQIQWNVPVLETGATQTVTLILQVPGAAAPAPKSVSSGALNIRKSGSSKASAGGEAANSPAAASPEAASPAASPAAASPSRGPPGS